MMPQSSQNLYFHLGMNADDDGFCEHFTIMRMTDSKPDDLKVLVAKKFVQVFDDKVLVVLDWKENNFIRKDRYTPSKYLEIYKKEIKQISDGRPLVNQRLTQVRLGKVRLGKVNNIMSDKKKEKKTENPNIQRIYEHYKEKIAPKARLTPDSKRKIVTRLKEFSADEIEKAIDNFSKDSWWMENCGWRGIRWFFHSQDRVLQFVEMKPRQKREYSNLTAEEEKELDEKYAEFD